MADKILFWIDAVLFHYCLAYYLQKQYQSDLYAIIDITNKPKNFFKEQKFVNFKKTWFYHDYLQNIDTKPDLDYVSKIEKQYGINLWKLAINERLFYRFNNFYNFKENEILSILEKECRFFENILEIKPDFVIGERPQMHHSQLFYEICKAKGIKFITIVQSRVGYKSILGHKDNELDSIKTFDEIKPTNRNFDQLREYISSHTVSKQLEDYKQKFAASKFEKIKAAGTFLFNFDNPNMDTHYSYFGRSKSRVLLDSINSTLKKSSRQKYINKNLKADFPASEKFVYFPLGLDEERNLLISTPFYTNQMETIRHIAKSLPIDYKLYVKEHPSMSIRDWRPIPEYKELMCIPNVRLFHPSMETSQFYENCSLVISTGGTSGFEAAFYQKPSIVFGDVNYSILSSVHKINSVQELPEAIRLSLTKKVSPEELDRFLILLEQNSVDFDWYGFITKIHDYFYYGGNLVDVEITFDKMKNFLEKNKDSLEKITHAHIKKIQQYKNN